MASKIEVIAEDVDEDGAPSKGPRAVVLEPRKVSKTSVVKMSDEAKISALEEKHGIKIPLAGVEGYCPLCPEPKKVPFAFLFLAKSTVSCVEIV